MSGPNPRPGRPGVPGRSRGHVQGQVTRGTTNPNRLRRVDRWTAGRCAAELRAAADPLVVDLGYGASPITVIELRDRLRAVRGDVEVIGVEIDPDRVARGRQWLDDAAAAGLDGSGLGFVRGGFELPLPQGRRPVLVRALNVLRQYDERQVPAAWQTLQDRLAPGGLLIEGTCDEIGRRAAWITLDASGPRSLTLATRLAGLERPGELAERLPKALIHRNVDGERVHHLLQTMDGAWARHAAMAGLGARQRWIATAESLRKKGFAVLDNRSRWRLGELTIAWSDVATR